MGYEAKNYLSFLSEGSTVGPWAPPLVLDGRDVRVEIVRSEYDDAFESFTPMDGSFAVCGWFYWLEVLRRRVYRGDRLVVLRHSTTGRFVLSAWVYGPDEAEVPIVQELEGFDRGPHEIWPLLLTPAQMAVRLRRVEEVQEESRRLRMRMQEEKKREAEEREYVRRRAARRLMKEGWKRDAEAMIRGSYPMEVPRGDEAEIWEG